MKKLYLLAITTLIAVGFTAGATASSIAGKLWYADLTGNDPALLYGGTVAIDLSENLFISGMYLTGTYKDIDGFSGLDYDTTDAEVIIGLRFNIVDIGIGGRYSEWTFSAGGDKFDIAIFGPMAYIGVGNLIGDLPLGWYVGGSYMFKDFGDADDYDMVDNFEHYNVEGGLFLSMQPLTATVGYRIKKYVNYDDLEFKGVTASFGFGF